MTNEKLNKQFEIPIEKIEDEIKTKINGDLSGYNTVVSPRALEQIDDILLFKTEIFERLLRRIPLRTDSNNKIFPYEYAEIRTFGREPKGCEIGQTFVTQQKVLAIMRDLEGRVFSGFQSNGLSQMNPVMIYGKDKECRKLIAFYIPPIIEIYEQKAVLIDGMNRSYICKSAGATLNAVHISNVSTPLPFEPIYWKDVSLVIEKPPIEQRYKNLRKEFFRDLSSIGIDG